MRLIANGGAVRVVTDKLPIRAIGSADGIGKVRCSRAMFVTVIRNQAKENGMSANLFLAADFRGCDVFSGIVFNEFSPLLASL